MNKDFLEWFHENEGYELRSERFYRGIYEFSEIGLEISLFKWLESAFIAGQQIVNKELHGQ